MATATNSPPLQPLSLRHEIGEVIKDRYTIRQVLGGGAFGTVYRVEETIGSRVVTLACKEMHVLDDPETAISERADALRMFQEEAYLLQTLRNPHIPAAHFESTKAVWLACPQCGRTFRGVRQCPDHGADLQVIHERYYLIMDFIEGHDLEEKLLSNSSRPLDEITVIDWTLQVCDALAAVHAKGFSHRDIKPANIKIQNDGNQAILIDFGLIKPSTVAGGYGTVLQRKSTGLGTLGYAPMSPQEQTQPDARTDILALGMTLYRLLTGRDPTDPADLETMRRNAPRTLNTNLSAGMNALIIKATQHDREQRYRDVAELRTDLLAVRYPVEVTCPHCGFAQRTPGQPDADSRCERCGRPLLTASSSSANAGTAPTTVLTPGNPAAAAAAKAAAARASAAANVVVTPVRVNPYESRLQKLREELERPPATVAPSPHDARIQEIESILGGVARFVVGPPNQCPACRKALLDIVQGQPSGACPLCDKAQLMRRQLDVQLCPICRDGSLSDHTLQEGQIFCPVCRAQPLQAVEQRRLLGLALDLWWHCPACDAEFDVTNNNQATLKQAGTDPYGVGHAHLNETKSVKAWREMADRANHYLACDKCAAQWDEVEPDKWKLARFDRDPHGNAMKLHGKLLTREQIQHMAHDLPSVAGSHHCPHCKAEFNYSRDEGTMTLLAAGNIWPDWAKHWRGVAVSLPAWYFAAAGKRSFHPGKVCRNCTTEFDDDGTLMKLASTTEPRLQSSIGQSLSNEDWRRRASGLPTINEATALRIEMKNLLARKTFEQAEQNREEIRRRTAMEEERKQLYKQSILQGYIPLRRMSPARSPDDLKHLPGTFVALPLSVAHIAMRPAEELRWESPANRCSVTTSRGQALWNRDASGMLMVTDQRILFINSDYDRTQQVWQYPIGQVTRAALFAVEKSVVLDLTFSTNTQVGFEVTGNNWYLQDQGQGFTIALLPNDLAVLIRSLANI